METTDGLGLNNTPHSIALATPKRSVVRLVVISDTHNRHAAVSRLLPQPAAADPPSEGDPSLQIPPPTPSPPSILIHCGDFADRGSLEHVQSFCRWLSSDENNPSSDGSGETMHGLPSHYHHVVVVHGNHDISRPPAPHIDLENEFAK